MSHSIFFPNLLLLQLSTIFCTVCLAIAQTPEDAGTQHSHSRSSGSFISAGTINITHEQLTPGDLKVSPGQTVVWLNSSGFPLRVTFTSKAVSITCKGPRGFVVDNKGIFQSKKIANGGVASLCFLEPNSYDYQVQFFKDSEEVPEDSNTLPGVVNVTTK